MRWRIIYIIIWIHLCFLTQAQNIDTIYLHPHQTNKNISYSLYYTIDSNHVFTADSVFSHSKNFSFKSSRHKALNFDFSAYTVWLKGIFKNTSDTSQTYIISVENADIDYLNFYYLDADSSIRTTITGELKPFQNRNVFHRIFLQRITFNPNETKEILISAFNSHNILYLPTTVHGEAGFNMRNLLIEFLNWFIIASLLFISLFNFYVWRTIKSKLSLYSAIFIFMAVIFVGFYDGYHFILNIPPKLSWIKWFSPCLFTIFLLQFTKTFTRENYAKNYPIKVFNIFIILVILFTLASPLPYPYMLLTYYTFPIIIGLCLIVVVFLSVTTTRYSYTPSIITLCGHAILLIGIVIHQLKEANALPSNVVTDGILKYAIVMQSILFTMAILENIRIKNKNTDLSIQNHLQFIEYQKWEMEMVNSELEKLSIVASETENAVAICDISGKIDWCNNAYEKLYDIDFGQLIKDGKRSLFAIHDSEAIKHNFLKCIDLEKVQVFEMNINTFHRKKVWVQSTLTPYIKDEVLTKIITIDTDISDLKKYQVRLEHAKDRAVESDKLKTAFLGNISHEIRTPLNGIIGFSELLELHTEKTDKVQQYINTIKSSGEQLLVIIDDLLDISLIETNQLKLKLIPCKLEEILLEVIQNYYGIKKTLNKDHIALTFNKNIDTNGIINTDPARVRQVLSNLLSNAFKFTEAGSISVNLDESSTDYTVSVTDTGIGIPVEKNEYLFKSFRQNESTLNRKFGGTGVGLAICKGIIDKLKGKIWIDPTYTQGARLCFSLKK